MPRQTKRKTEPAAQRKLDDALKDSFPASDPVSFLEPGHPDAAKPAAPRTRPGRKRKAAAGTNKTD